MDPSGPGCGTTDLGGCINDAAGVVASGAKAAAGAIAHVAPIAAPLTDLAAGVGCVAQPEICVPVLIGNTIGQGVSMGAKAVSGGYSLADAVGDAAALATGDALGGLGALAVKNAGLGLVGKSLLAYAVGAPQMLLDNFLIQPADAATGSCGT